MGDQRWEDLGRLDRLWKEAEPGVGQQAWAPGVDHCLPYHTPPSTHTLPSSHPSPTLPFPSACLCHLYLGQDHTPTHPTYHAVAPTTTTTTHPTATTPPLHTSHAMPPHTCAHTCHTGPHYTTDITCLPCLPATTVSTLPCLPHSCRALHWEAFSHHQTNHT